MRYAMGYLAVGAVSPDDAADIREFAVQLVGEAASPPETDLARAVAEAQLSLARPCRTGAPLREPHVGYAIAADGAS